MSQAKRPGKSAVRPTKGRYSVNAVDRALAILGAVAESDVISLADATRVAGVSKSTAFRLLATLAEKGLVEQLADGGYRTGTLALQWAGQILSRVDLRTAARPVLERLREETGETVNLAVLREGGLVYVDILESPAMLRSVDVPGASAPLHATALGKAVAAHLTPDRLARLLGPEPYPSLTKKTSSTWQKLAPRIEEARTRGYAVDLEEAAAGAACVAAAVVAGGHVLGAISVTGPSSRIGPSRIPGIGRRLCEAAVEIGSRVPPASVVGARPAAF